MSEGEKAAVAGGASLGTQAVAETMAPGAGASPGTTLSTRES